MRVALIVVTYNHAKFIIEALDGIFQQTRPADEIVIADDGSTDDTREIIRDYVRTRGLEERCKLLLSEQNRGINPNLQNAIDHTSAEAIVGVAGDDIVLPNALALFEQLFANNPTVNHIVTAGYVIDDQGQQIREINYTDTLHTNVVAAIKQGFAPAGSAVSAWRRKLFTVFGPLPAELPNEDDQTLFRGLLLGGILVSSGKTYKYRIHSKSMSSWLRSPTTDELFFEQFKANQSVRRDNMIHWRAALNKIQLDDQLTLVALLEKKAAFYQWLQDVDKVPFFERLAFLLRNLSILGRRESFYTLFGKTGILGWRRMRRLLGRA